MTEEDGGGRRRADEGGGGRRRAEEGGGGRRAEEGGGGRRRAEEGGGGRRRADEDSGGRRRTKVGCAKSLQIRGIRASWCRNTKASNEDAIVYTIYISDRCHSPKQIRSRKQLTDSETNSASAAISEGRFRVRDIFRICESINAEQIEIEQSQRKDACAGQNRNFRIKNVGIMPRCLDAENRIEPRNLFG